MIDGKKIDRKRNVWVLFLSPKHLVGAGEESISQISESLPLCLLLFYFFSLDMSISIVLLFLSLHEHLVYFFHPLESLGRPIIKLGIPAGT